MPFIGRSVILGNLLSGDLDGAVLPDQVCDLVVGPAALSQGFDFVADHSNKGLNWELFRSEPSCRT